MQTLDCNIGFWKARAKIQDADNGKVMAIISATGTRGDNINESRHTIVFEHQEGCDALDETKALLTKLLQDRYGV